jgi:hypothetical protein
MHPVFEPADYRERTARAQQIRVPKPVHGDARFISVT